MKDLQVKYTDPLDLIPYENNPRINDYAVKKVMSGVREMTLAEEIRNLAELGVDQNVIDRMTQKYNRMLTDHGNTCNKIRDEVYREVRGVKAELAEKETIIRVLTTHIREKELL